MKINTTSKMLGEKNLARRTIGELPWSRGEIVKGNLTQKPDAITIDTHRKIGYYFVRPHYDVNSLGALLPFSTNDVKVYILQSWLLCLVSKSALLLTHF